MNENGNMQQGNQNQQNKQTQERYYTVIRVYSGNDGYGLELMNPEAKNGNRIDQKLAMLIMNLDKQLCDPNFVNMLKQSQQNPMGFMQGMFQRMFGGGGMPPMMGGGFPPMGGFM